MAIFSLTIILIIGINPIFAQPLLILPSDKESLWVRLSYDEIIPGELTTTAPESVLFQNNSKMTVLPVETLELDFRILNLTVPSELQNWCKEIP